MRKGHRRADAHGPALSGEAGCGDGEVDQANIAQYKLDLVYCHITAPVAGRVGLRLVDPGNYVTSGSSPGIVVITTMTPTLVQFTVAQNDLASVAQRVAAGAQLPVTALSSDNTTRSPPARSTPKQPDDDLDGHGLDARHLPERGRGAVPERIRERAAAGQHPHDAVLVPTPAVLSGAPGDYVYLVNTTDKTVSARKVTLGPSDGKNTAITAGLAAGDTVVIDGTDRLSDGAKISIAAPGAAAAKPGEAPAAAPAAHAHNKGAAPSQGTNGAG